MKSPNKNFTFKNYSNLYVIKYLKKKLPGKVNKIDLAGFGNLPLFDIPIISRSPLLKKVLMKWEKRPHGYYSGSSKKKIP